MEYRLVDLHDAILAAAEAVGVDVLDAPAEEEPRTLESLGKELGLSKERVRQLEAAAFSKMRKYLEKNSQEVVSFF